jgi:hypothetical protein
MAGSLWCLATKKIQITCSNDSKKLNGWRFKACPLTLPSQWSRLNDAGAFEQITGVNLDRPPGQGL